MKTVLIVGADFAPSSLPPATRIRLFARHLPEFGWQPVVLTTHPDFYEARVDPENERLLPSAMEVIRTKAFAARWTRKIGVGDVGMRSLWHHWQAVKTLCRERQIDLLLIPVPPYVSMVLGRLAHHKFGLPYIIDYIDPWVSSHSDKLPRSQRLPKSGLANLLARTLEPIALKNVAHITGVSKGTTDKVVSRYSQMSEAQTSEIPYGAEQADFDYLNRSPRPNPIFQPGGGLLHVSYVGACIPEMHGAVRALFGAVRSGLVRAPQLFSRLRLHFAGSNYATSVPGRSALLSLAVKAGIEALVDEHPSRISYLDSLQVMLDSKALVLLGSSEPHYTASKVFPYILARRPLLAIVHEKSSVVRLLSETQAGEVVVFNGDSVPTAATGEISALLETMLLSKTRPETHWEAFEHYTARAMTARLASAFESAVSRREPQDIQTSARASAV